MPITPWQVPTTLTPGTLSPEDVNTLHAFMMPGQSPGPGGSVMDPVQLAGLRSMQQSELEDSVAADPTDQRHRILLQFLNRDMDEDPYTGKQAMADSEYMRPDQEAIRQQKIAEVGQQAQATAKGTAYGQGTGTAEAAMTLPAQDAANLASQRKINEETAPITAKFGPDGDATIGALANSWRADPTYPVPPDFKDAVAARAATMGPLDPKLTNQTRQMSEGATDILASLPEALQLANTLKDKGLFHPVVGSVRTTFASHGLGSLMGVDDETASDIGRFNSLIEAIKSGFARAHAGARGAGNSQMAERFDKLVPVQGDYPTFLGGLQGMADMLQRYSMHTNPNAVNTADPWAAPPTAAEMAGQ